MKKILLILKRIEDYNETEMFCVSISRALAEAGENVMVFAELINGNESTDMMHARGVRMYDIEHKSAEFLNQEYDAIIALDEWAIANVPRSITGKIKFKLGITADVEKAVEIIIEKIEGAKPVETSVPESEPADNPPVKKAVAVKPKNKTKKKKK